MQTGRKVHIFYPSFYDIDKEQIVIGGVQNYLLYFARFLVKNGYQPIIYQNATQDFQIDYESFLIKGFYTGLSNENAKCIKRIHRNVQHSIIPEDIIIWGSERVSIKNHHKKCIAIQHGISFDYIPFQNHNELYYNQPLKAKVYKFFQNQKAINDFKKCKNVVCVDYNYLNWIRTMLPRYYTNNITVIPNFGIYSDKDHINQTHQNDKPIKILFSRTLSAMRGVFILTEIIDYFLKNNSLVYFTICGDGKYLSDLKKRYNGEERVEIMRYSVGESETVYLNHHINLVPSYGSEGTSFSLLEGMGYGSVPIATNVGGMTNILIDGLNGYLVNPDAKSFIQKIDYLINSHKTRQQMSLAAKKSIESGFDINLWEEKWLTYLKKFAHV